MTGFVSFLKNFLRLPYMFKKNMNEMIRKKNNDCASLIGFERKLNLIGA